MEKMKASLAFANLANPSHTLCLADSTCVIAIARPANMSSPRAISASCSTGSPAANPVLLQSVGQALLFSLSLHVLSLQVGVGAQVFVFFPQRLLFTEHEKIIKKTSIWRFRLKKPNFSLQKSKQLRPASCNATKLNTYIMPPNFILLTTWKLFGVFLFRFQAS